MKRGNNHWADFILKVDDTPYFTFILSTGDHGEPGGCATITVQLTAGQVVSVQNDQSTSIYGTDSTGAYNSWFTGRLLYLL